jgi:hypothetical protein
VHDAGFLSSVFVLFLNCSIRPPNGLSSGHHGHVEKRGKPLPSATPPDYDFSRSIDGQGKSVMSEGWTGASGARVAAGVATDVSAALARRVTIAVSLREGHGLALPALDDLLAHTPPGTPLLYLDIASPPPVRAQLERRAAEHGFTLLHFDAGTWPSTTRAAAVAQVTTEYVVFMENDVLVAPGWLDALVRCADETGAGLVGPLYLEGGGAEPVTVHMAGGTLTRRRTEAGEALDEDHRLMHAPLVIARDCRRQECDFVEFHCLLARREVFARGVSLDRGIGCVHDHIDLSLQVTALGLPIWLEPQAKVLQLRDGDYLLSDLPLLRWRWNEDAVETSIANFCRHWNFARDEQAFSGVRRFSDDRRRQLDPVRNDLPPAGPVEMRQVARDKATLHRQMIDAGYSGDDCWRTMTACDLAAHIHRRSLRANDRPFIEHPVGAASLLIRHRFPASFATVALLHAAYSHGRLNDDRPDALDERAREIVAACSATIERQVRTVTGLLANPRAWIAYRREDALRMSALPLIAVTTALLIDELAAQPPAMSASLDRAAWHALLDPVMQQIGRPDLTAALTAASPAGFSWDWFAQRRRAVRSSSSSAAAPHPLENRWYRAWLRQPSTHVARTEADARPRQDNLAATG